jgi:hypothetical protein
MTRRIEETSGLTSPDFQRLAARLSLTVDSLDIEQNGLGYNNLIYMAVVLSELSLNPDAAYKALIVEEPEAHMHPQMPAVLLQYLESKEKPEPNEKAVQVFVTSHSPNFAAIAKIDTIGCLSVLAFEPNSPPQRVSRIPVCSSVAASYCDAPLLGPQRSSSHFVSVVCPGPHINPQLLRTRSGSQPHVA